jgi:hypothetical protein
VSRVAWVLNLDADLELAASARKVLYTPTNAIRAAMAPHVARLAGSLIGSDDLLIDETSAPGVARGLVGRAFCPTSRAIALLVSAGAEPERHPPQEVLREVNGRAFCASLGPTLPDAAFVRALDAALAVLGRTPEVANEWRVKRAFGMSGRGQRTILPSAIGDPDRAFLRAGIAEGGVMIEPNVTIVRELAVHGILDEDGAFSLGCLVTQHCDARGQWLASAPAQDVDPATADALFAEAHRVAAALHGARYFGPFGLDAFVYRDKSGTNRLQPRSEINARYSMGFAVGMGRRDGAIGSR